MRHILSAGSGEDGHGCKTSHENSVNTISDELSFLLPLMRKYPKCYWIWNYRLWLLEQSTHCLPAVAGRQLWQQELALASKMLSLDSRNFHGWGYRRTVVNALESPELQTDGSASTLTEQEFDYTTKMINTNLSNFSAWHTRSKLIPKLLTEKQADKVARRKFLDEGTKPLALYQSLPLLTYSSELELIQRALWAGSEDQSLWFYHQNLMSTFDPKYAADSMAPDLSEEERSVYVTQEIGRLQEMLDGAEDCKWIYQSLISLSILHKSLRSRWPVVLSEIGHWVDELTELDPLRAKRWADLRRDLEAP